MRFRMFSNQHSPIAIDFGAASVKLLQVALGEKPTVIAAAELAVPDAVRDDPAQRISHLEAQLPAILKSGGFKGRRAVCAVPTGQTIIQHLQVAVPDGARLFDVAKSQIHMSMNMPPDSLVVRAHEVAQVQRDMSGGGGGGGSRIEVICLAIPRDLIMRHIELLEKCRMEVVGVQAQPTAMVRAFDHIHRRSGDENLTTMYIDMGYSCTAVAVAHGAQMTFARAIQVGGLHFDRLIAKALRCDLAGARAHRLSLADPLADQAAAKSPASAERQASEEQADGLVQLRAAMKREHNAAEDGTRADGATLTAEDRRKGLAAPVIAQSVEPGEGHTSAANVDFTEVLETITDEMSMCLRYHRGLFPGRAIDRVVILGGEARLTWLCRHVAKSLRLPARLGDPLAQYTFGSGAGADCLPDHSQPHPGWSTVCGLCADSGDTRA